MTTPGRERALWLIEAYGADPNRWPADERALAETIETDAILSKARDEAARLDALLGAHGDLSPGAALAGRVTLQAQGAQRRWRRLRTWWMLAALGGLGLAGAATGAGAMAVLSPAVPSYELYDLPTVFGAGQDFMGG